MNVIQDAPELIQDILNILNGRYHDKNQDTAGGVLNFLNGRYSGPRRAPPE